MTQIPRPVLVPAAILAGLCPLAANSVHTTSSDGDAVLTDAAAWAGGQQLALALFLVGFTALVVVLGVLAAAVAGRSPALGAITVVAGAAGIAIKLGEAQMLVALHDAPPDLSPATAELLVGVHEAGFAVYGFLVSIALGAAGLGLVRSRLAPAWLGWWGAVAGGFGVVAAVVGIVAPPSYVPIPFLLLLLWLIVLGVTAVRRPLVDSAPARALAPTQ